jgi:hypothetical protein
LIDAHNPQSLTTPAKGDDLPTMRLLYQQLTCGTASGIWITAPTIRVLLGTSIQRLLFVPYAIHDTALTRRPCDRFMMLSYGVDAVHDAEGGPLAQSSRPSDLHRWW